MLKAFKTEMDPTLDQIQTIQHNRELSMALQSVHILQ
jgi:hypothetical protein